MVKEIKSIYIVDWRQIGDFSAVGQLSQKIFRQLKKDITVNQFVTNWNNQKVKYISLSEKGNVTNNIDWQIYPDACLSEYNDKKDNKVLYVRLSPHRETLELAVKLYLSSSGTPLIVHYMDKPFLDKMSNTERKYILGLYRFLINHATKFYTIHDSSIPELNEKYNREVSVLGNFIQQNDQKDSIYEAYSKNEKKMTISYFGSLDQKMNATSIFNFMKAINNAEEFNFVIYTNSGVPLYMKDLISNSKNIKVTNSSLSQHDYIETLRQSDFLLLPYNLDAKSEEFLQHSFSNKIIDYLESGSKVLALGSEKIPTIKFCIKNDVALILNDLIEKPKELISSILVYKEKNIQKNIDHVIKNTNNNLTEFILTLEDLFLSDRTNKTNQLSNKINPGILNFLIKRNIFDKKSNQQSLSATISASILVKSGYKGFDYEI